MKIGITILITCTKHEYIKVQIKLMNYYSIPMRYVN